MYEPHIFSFGTVHSDRTGSLVTQTLLVSDCWHLMLFKCIMLSLILSAWSRIIHTLLWESVTLRCLSIVRSPFSSLLSMSNFSSVLIGCHWFFTQIALSDVDLCFSLMLVRNANAVDEETKVSTWLYDQHNQSTHMMDGLLQKIRVAMDRSCQIMFNWCMFSSLIKAKSRKKKSCKMRPHCTVLWN